MKKQIDRIYEYLDFKGIKPTLFAKQISISQGYLSTQFKRNADVGGAVLEKIIQYCEDISPEWLLTGKGSMLRSELPIVVPSANQLKSVYHPKYPDKIQDVQFIPIYDILASAGFWENTQDVKHMEPIEWVSIPNLGKCDGGIFAVGDSMYPLIKAGDRCIYREINVQDILWGNIYILNIIQSTGEAFTCIKYVKKSELGEKYVLLESYNRHHAPIDMLKKNIRNVALVKMTMTMHNY